MLQRQLPQETVFMSNSSNSFVDPLHRERIYFTFPKNWSTNVTKHAIIGIRSIYVTRAFRRCLLTLRQKLKYRDMSGDEIDVETHDVKVSKFFKDDTLLQEFIAKIAYKLGEVKWSDTNAPHINDTETLECYYDFIEETDTHRSRFVIHSPYNDIPENDRKTNVSVGSGLVEERTYYIEFEVVDINEDCSIILNYSKPETRPKLSEPIITYDIWDRDSCIVYSNLAYMSDHNFLGHTRRYEMNNLKYYEINNCNQTFWVDLYTSVDHKCPVYLSSDRKDELYIEATLLTSANAVL